MLCNHVYAFNNNTVVFYVNADYFAGFVFIFAGDYLYGIAFLIFIDIAVLL